MEQEVKNDILPETGYIRLLEVLELLGISKSSWYVAIKSGKYPRPVKIRARVSAWRVGDVRG